MIVKYVPFGDDVILAALAEVCDPCVLVFPTLAAAEMARRAFQSQWALQDLRCVDMETLKKELIPAPGPFLQDEKRMLCLYAALDEEDRRLFHISSYSDVISWGGQFFHFFEEIRDECAREDLLTSSEGKALLRTLTWQDEHIWRLLAIKKRYHSQIQAMGYTDAIFWMDEEHIRLPEQTCRYVFVNQYYYSGLEKRLIARLEDNNHEVLIIHQGVEGSFNVDDMSSIAPDLTTLDPSCFRLKRLEFRASETQDQMVLSFLADLGDGVDDKLRQMDGKPSRVLVDRDFGSKNYKGYYSPALFNYSESTPFHHTQLYKLLALRVRHVKSMQATLGGRYLPLAELLNACSAPGFIHSLCPRWVVSTRMLFLKELKYLIQNDFLYIDRELTLPSLLDKPLPHLVELARVYFDILQDTTLISTIGDIANLTDSRPGWMLRELCTPEEWQHPELASLYYERLANFKSLEDLGIVRNWQDVFPDGDTPLGAFLLKLWLDFLAPATLKSTHPHGRDCLYDVKGLLDTRNIRYDEAVVLNAVEDILPSNPEAVWLLNEAQRKALKLKTYEMVRARERYYFLRLILGCESASLCYYNNQDKDIEPGSFVTELLYLHDTGALNGIEVVISDCRPPAKLLFDARSILAQNETRPLPEKDATLTGIDPVDPEAFFRIPCEPGLDFAPDNIIRSGSYDIDLLTKHPFAWYLKTRGGLREEKLPPEETLTPKFFGTILHRFLMTVLDQVKGKHQGTARLRQVFENTEALAGKLRGILTSPLYVFCVPQNYNQEFLVGIISDCLVESVQRFYSDFLEPRLQRQEFELLPEQESMTESERRYRELATFGDETDPGAVRIHGKVDLRIETPGQNIIVDFKSGRSMDAGQLIFYEYFYYLLDPDYDGAPIHSLFWSILDFEARDDKIDDTKRAKWREGIVQTIDECLQHGFYMAKVAKDRKELVGITRADIYANQHWRRS